LELVTHLVTLQSTRAAALKVIKEDGIVGLYDGLSSSLLGIAITNGYVELAARNDLG
jgi:hypothetical protein